MIDMKKKEIYNAYNDTAPAETITNAIQTASASANHVNSFPGDIHFIVKLPERRPIINKAIPPNASIREASIFVICGSASVT